jgi:hypothetical protein
MNNPVECIHCHVAMESGFVLDGRHEGFAQEQWYSGKAKPSFWMGLKLEKDKIITVTTWRCPKCGYLESYAVRGDASQ